jgi:hypothetical protein
VIIDVLSMTSVCVYRSECLYVYEYLCLHCVSKKMFDKLYVGSIFVPRCLKFISVVTHQCLLSLNFFLLTSYPLICLFIKGKGKIANTHLHHRWIPTCIIGGISYTHLQVFLFQSTTCKYHIIFIYSLHNFDQLMSHLFDIQHSS